MSVYSSGIGLEKDRLYLVNLNPDPALNELLVYYLKVGHLTMNKRGHGGCF